MEIEDSRQYKALRQAQAFGSEAQARRGLTIDSERPGVTMAEMDAYYEGWLKEIEELEKIADSNLVNSSKGKGGNHGKKSGQEDNQKG